MHGLLVKILGRTLLLMFWCNKISGKSHGIFMTNARENSNSSTRQNITQNQLLNKREINGLIVNNDLFNQRSIDTRSYYSNAPAAYVPAFDPISVLASLAFLAFIMQSFAALFDRTRSIIPTIISSRQSNSAYGEQLAEVERRVLRALDEYASLSNDILDDTKGDTKVAL